MRLYGMPGFDKMNNHPCTLKASRPTASVSRTDLNDIEICTINLFMFHCYRCLFIIFLSHCITASYFT